MEYLTNEQGWALDDIESQCQTPVRGSAVVSTDEDTVKFLLKNNYISSYELVKEDEHNYRVTVNSFHDYWKNCNHVYKNIKNLIN